MEKLFIKPGRDKSLKLRHQWVFSGAVKNLTGEVEDGEIVEIVDAQGNFLAYGAYSSCSQIAARVWSFDVNATIDEAFLHQRLEQAIAYRRQLNLPLSGPCGVRLIDSEADQMPGFIVDKYADILVMQVLSAGAEKFKRAVARQLMQLTQAQGVWERSDVAVRSKENLPETTGLLAGIVPEGLIEITENQCRYQVDIRQGHKTGFYLDQRDSRQIVGQLSAGKRVLNCFSYTGGFGVAAALNKAKMVTNVDSSAPALALAKANFELNRIAPEQFENIVGDVFSVLRKFRSEHRQFDVIVLDPPKLIESQKSLLRGCKAYKDMALVAYQILAPGGILASFSCSGLMTAELFQKITFEAALDAGVNAKIVRHLEQAPDHPTLLTQPEGFYLKGLLTAL